jgi:hypothetical protein
MDTRHNNDDLIPDRDVAEHRYHVHIKTLSRWDMQREKAEAAAERGDVSKPAKPMFPRAIEINGRKYRRRRELEAFEHASVVNRATQQRKYQAQLERVAHARAGKKHPAANTAV